MRVATILILFFTFIHVYSQYPEKYFTEYETLNKKDSGTIKLNINNINFLKNNEYFNEIVEGYTLLGFWCRPNISYQISEKSEVAAGLDVLKYSGREGVYKILPFFRFRHVFNDNIELVMGNLYGRLDHHLAEPILDPELTIRDKQENGVQFLLKSEYIKSDVWINWEHFIMLGDSAQEQLTGGTSTLISLTGTNEELKLEIPVQLILTHKGGQINVGNSALETISNFGTGFNVRIKTDNSFLKSLSFENMGFLYKNLSPEKKRVLNSGWALYPAVVAESGWWQCKLGWWHSNKFFGPRGEDIYQAISPANLGYFENKRDLGVLKLGLFNKYAGKVLLAAQFEGYYNPTTKLFDYNYGLQIVYNGIFRLR